MRGYCTVGLTLFFVLFFAHGSFATQIEDRQDVLIGQENETQSERFPFFKDHIPIETDVKDHMYLRLKVTRKIAEGEEKQNETKLRIFFWPDTGNCAVNGQLTNGVMRMNATFVVEKAKYEDGLCMTATREVDPNGDQSVYTLPRSELIINSTATLDVTLEGNGSNMERYVATWGVIGFFVIFCALFFLLWWLLVYPGTALKPKLRSANLSAPDSEHQVTNLRLARLNVLGDNDKESGKTALSWKMMITTSILYFLPSLQFTVKQSTLYRIDGNQDHCFFNFACLKPDPLTGAKMWNHILSNVGYMFLGLLFLLVTFVKENVILRRKLKRMSVEPTKEGCWPRILELRRQVFETSKLMPNQQTGTCASFSLFYTMGLTLFMIGVMSSCYHLCPTDVNFQFDTTYMYLLAIFMTINLFKSRHPDLSPDATTAFALLAISVFFGVVSVYMDVDIQDDYLNIIFLVSFLWGCATFAVVFYGVDSVDLAGKVDLKNKENFQWINGAGWKIIYLWVPRLTKHILDNWRTKFKSKTRFWFLVIFMSVNTMLGIALLLIFETDFPSVLLFIFLTNVGMYLTFYLVMKKLAGERLTWPTLIFLVLTAVFMLPALYFFRSEVKDTGVGPALSKEINQPCFEGLNYFDNHDVWHFLSSFGLFFALAFLLTLDDDVAEYDQANIQVW